LLNQAPKGLVTSLPSPLGKGRGAILHGGILLMELNKEEQVFLRLLMRDAWYDCDMRNKSQSERKIFLQIQSKLSRVLTNV
jgi:hypothetical protein